MKTDTNFPRIEFYSEVDLGDPNAGSNKWEFGGKTVYGGRADHQPHIKRKTITLSDQQKKDLLNQQLVFLPYFKEQKPGITLEQYFSLSQNSRQKFRELFPVSLDGLYSHKETDFFSTKLVYENSYESGLTVIWLSPSVWYLDEVYYRIESLEKFVQKEQTHEEVIMEGALNDFLRLSPIFQLKLHEGFSELTPKTERPVIPPNNMVFSYQLTPGMPNTISYYYEVWSDGTIKQAGGAAQKVSYLFVTKLLLKSLRLDWKNYERLANEAPPAFAHDKQVVLLNIWNEGHNYKLHDPDMSSGLPLENFRDFALNLIGEELSAQ